MANQDLDGPKRSGSFSQNSETSQTAQDYIATQLSLEADAREALPYQFDTCTKPLGPLRQSVYACLTCTPPPASVHQQFTPAGVCYSCSISCHSEHTLVELFTKRDFVCDCGTTRLSNSGTPCTLRHNAQTQSKGNVTGEEAREGNAYNQNFQGKFCGCGDEYDPEKEKGTMFQCLGLGTVEQGGCGEDWWHPECLMGLPRNRHDSELKSESNGKLETVKEETGDQHDGNDQDRNVEVDTTPLPPGFPQEDDFDHLICYKCTSAFPWIKQYAGTAGFLPAVPAKLTSALDGVKDKNSPGDVGQGSSGSKKRSAEDDLQDAQCNKKAKGENGTDGIEQSVVKSEQQQANGSANIRHDSLPSAPNYTLSLFVTEDFRDNLCRCPECFPRLLKHPQLLEEEENYEPPLSESDGPQENGSVTGRSLHSGSLLDRGEVALSSMDRVRAIEGVMAYNHVRDKVKAFLQPFAESGQPVSAEDIKTYFAKLRGDDQANRDATVDTGNGAVQGDGRKEQDGY